MDLMLEALGDPKGLAWAPDWPGDARKGWIALGPEPEHYFTRIQGSRARPTWRVIWLFCALLSTNNCLIQGTFISELLDLRLRKVTVELLTGQLLRSLVAPSSRGRRIYIYILAHNLYTFPSMYLSLYISAGPSKRVPPGCGESVQSKVQQLPS